MFAFLLNAIVDNDVLDRGVAIQYIKNRICAHLQVPKQNASYYRVFEFTQLLAVKQRTIMH